MARRIALIAVLIALLPLGSGCPNGASALLGNWTFTVENADTGVTLNSDGSATSFFIDGMIAGDLSFEVDGSKFILNVSRDDGTETALIGTITSDSTMNGAGIVWAGSDIGDSTLWSAVKQ